MIAIRTPFFSLLLLMLVLSLDALPAARAAPVAAPHSSAHLAARSPYKAPRIGIAIKAPGRRGSLEELEDGVGVTLSLKHVEGRGGDSGVVSDVCCAAMEQVLDG